MITINETTDYNQFKLYEGNRSVNPTRLISSIQKKNMLSCHPIIVNKKMEVVDGQHRLEAAKMLNLPIYYIIDEDQKPEDIPLHQIQKIWKIPDYLKLYRKKISDYDFIGKLSEKYKIPIHQAVFLTAKQQDRYKAFREGKYSLKNSREYFEEKFKLLWEASEICKKTLSLYVLDKDMLHALFKLVCTKGYDAKKFSKKCSMYPGILKTAFSFKSRIHIYDHIMEKLLFRREKRNQDE